MMTVHEMIELLARYPDDMRVVVSGYENGYDDLSLEQIRVTPVVLDYGTHEWDGRHEDVCDLPVAARADAQTKEVLTLRRTSASC
ncbi:MAG: hypothetical protein F4103_14750 [Boseongicola sp. SB0673_bin_14]|nr:hypothetical protein [Boseongicola sp. SB0667_bin_21]MYI69935.1 hypothetical protein [Boseongicola sp. SB0673_bin_14]